MLIRIRRMCRIRFWRDGCWFGGRGGEIMCMQNQIINNETVIAQLERTREITDL